jgi:hypothetical protein
MSFTFLIASERSGSNFITKLFNAHSKICGPATKHLFNPVLRNLFRYTPLTDAKNWNELVNDIYKLYSVEFSEWKSSFSKEDLHSFAPRGQVYTLLRNIFYEEAKLHDKNHVFVKENHVYEFLPHLLINFPEAQYIYLVRDPRDVALSWRKNKVHPGGIVKAARQWQKDQQKSLKNAYLLRKENKLARVKYEHLITNPAKEVSRLLGFLGFDYEPEMLKFHEDKLTQKNAEKQGSWKNLSKSVMSENKGKYKEGLSEQETKYVEKICYHEMVVLEYNPENDHQDLINIPEKKIQDYAKEEEHEIELERTKGVRENMNAKKTFYKKLI